jgi:[1-hydroxy-2-(trimethylamino)ethyl]phosphonate dioxygenase
MTIADEVMAIFAERGSGAYFGESVTMTEHMLQAAHFARTEAADHALVVAALLHDIGHLVEQVPDDIKDWVQDAHHEAVGGQWLARRFPLAVSEPVRLHVPAKRYLCATDPAYFSKLSPASVVTLELQGGPMSADEIALFESEPYYAHAVRVRRWDDQGKVVGLAMADLASYGALLDELALDES